MSPATWLSLALLLLGLLLWVSRNAGKVSRERAHELVRDGALLVDVRSPEEFTRGHLEHALNIPLPELARRSGELGPKTQPLVVTCQSGLRSRAARGLLLRLGYSAVFDLGAMRNW